MSASYIKYSCFSVVGRRWMVEVGGQLEDVADVREDRGPGQREVRRGGLHHCLPVLRLWPGDKQMQAQNIADDRSPSLSEAGPRSPVVGDRLQVISKCLKSVSSDCS